MCCCAKKYKIVRLSNLRVIVQRFYLCLIFSPVSAALKSNHVAFHRIFFEATSYVSLYISPPRCIGFLISTFIAIAFLMPRISVRHSGRVSTEPITGPRAAHTGRRGWDPTAESHPCQSMGSFLEHNNSQKALIIKHYLSGLVSSVPRLMLRFLIFQTSVKTLLVQTLWILDDCLVRLLRVRCDMENKVTQSLNYLRSRP